MTYVLALDAGTSSVRASLYDPDGRPALSLAVEHEPATTPDGGVEMDADALFERCLACVERLLEQAGPRADEIAGVGICTFWHSILGVDPGGRPVTPILLWADTRSVDEVAELRRRLDEAAVHERTGCVQHTSYVPSKLLWLSRHRPEAFRRAARWLSPGEYLLLRLFGVAACSISMASGTGMYNHAGRRWDEEVLSILPVHEAQLSPIVDTLEPLQGLRPEYAARFPALARVPWFPAAGDGACSSLGSGCAVPDRLALMVGTSGALRMLREGQEPPPPPGLWKYRLDSRRYLIGGALSNGGNLFTWMRDTLRLPEGEALERALAGSAPDGHGLTILPFLAGERCPGWRGDARAAIVGLSWSTPPVEILRAGMEAVAHRFALIHELLRPVAPPEHRVIASGGALLASPAWSQIVADALGQELHASLESEASARGAALLALEGTGLIRDPAALPPRTGRVYRPDPERHALYRAARERQARLYRALIDPGWGG